MNETLGTNIMRLRKEAGLTQEQLANALGISYQAVSKWENGVSCPDISTLPLIADLFGVSIDSLFGRETEAPAVVQEEPKRAPRTTPGPMTTPCTRCCFGDTTISAAETWIIRRKSGSSFAMKARPSTSTAIFPSPARGMCRATSRQAAEWTAAAWARA